MMIRYLCVTILTIFIMVPVARSEEKTVFEYDDGGRRDPMWTLVSPSGTIFNYEATFLLTDLSLEGTMSTDAGGLAIINGQILNINDKIGQYILTEVYENSVVLTSGGKKYTLKIMPR